LQTVPGAGSAVSQYNVFTVTGSFTHRVGRERLYSTATITNFNSETRYGDTLLVTGLTYFLNQESFTWGKQTIFSLLNIGFDTKQGVPIKDFTWQMNDMFPIGKAQLTIGSQLSRRFYETTLFVGETANFQIPMGSRGEVGMSFQYLHSLEKPNRERRKEWFGELFCRYQLL
jgi:hypothetical protein